MTEETIEVVLHRLKLYYPKAGKRRRVVKKWKNALRKGWTPFLGKGFWFGMAAGEMIREIMKREPFGRTVFLDSAPVELTRPIDYIVVDIEV